MAATEATPTVNNVQLTSLDAVEQAFDYLTDAYNDGDVVRRDDLGTILLTARSGRLQHLGGLLDAHARGQLVITDVRTFNGKQIVEVSE